MGTTIYRAKPDDTLRDIALHVVDWIDRRIEHGLPDDCQLTTARPDYGHRCAPVEVWSSHQVDVIHRQLGRVERAILDAGPSPDDFPDWCLDEIALIVEGLGRPETYFGTTNHAPDTLGLWAKSSLGLAQRYIGQEIPGNGDNLWFQRFTMDQSDGSWTTLRIVPRPERQG